MPWIGCGAGCPPEMTGDAAGSTAYTFRSGQRGFSTSAQAVNVPASADARDDRVHPVREVGGDLLGGGADVDVDVSRVLELLRDPGARRLRLQLLGPGDGALHALLARGQVEAGAVGLHQVAAFDRHAFRHDQDQLVALHRGHHGQADAGVARGRLNDGATGLQVAIRFGSLDHGQRDAVLDGAAGVRAFGLDPNVGVGEQVGHPDVRRAADGVEDALGLHGTVSPKLQKRQR